MIDSAWSVSAYWTRTRRHFCAMEKFTVELITLGNFEIFCWILMTQWKVKLFLIFRDIYFFAKFFLLLINSCWQFSFYLFIFYAIHQRNFCFCTCLYYIYCIEKEFLFLNSHSSKPLHFTTIMPNSNDYVLPQISSKSQNIPFACHQCQFCFKIAFLLQQHKTTANNDKND